MWQYSIGVAVEEYHIFTIYIFTLYTNCQSDFFPRAFLSASLNKMFIVFTMFQHCIDHRYQVSFRKSGGGGFRRGGGGWEEGDLLLGKTFLSLCFALPSTIPPLT